MAIWEQYTKTDVSHNPGILQRLGLQNRQNGLITGEPRPSWSAVGVEAAKEENRSDGVASKRWMSSGVGCKTHEESSS